MEVALAESAVYLLDKLPIYVHNAQFLGHQNHGGRKGMSTIKKLCYHVAKAIHSAHSARYIDKGL